MSHSKKIHLLGYASGLAGAHPKSANGPIVIQKSPFLHALNENIEWKKIIKPESDKNASKLTLVAKACEQLANETYHLTQQKKFFTVLGGDHSSAIGTWSGVSEALRPLGSLGLIWIDAHMDSHTPHTSHSGNIHGMPLASLLGYGTPSLTTILGNDPKLKPENICLIGVRSFERGEAALLKQLNIRIFFMEEVKERGLHVILQEALQIVTKNTAGFGLSLDIDSIDPMDAPGTGVPEPNGIRAQVLCQGIQEISAQSSFLGCEIVEFDPEFDKNHKTEKLIIHLMSALALGNQYLSAKSCCSAEFA